MSGKNVEEDKENQKTRVKDKLKKYLARRPSFVELESKGIIKGMLYHIIYADNVTENCYNSYKYLQSNIGKIILKKKKQKKTQ